MDCVQLILPSVKARLPDDALEDADNPTHANPIHIAPV
jgi:hypothetical protein